VQRKCFLCGRNGWGDPLEKHHIFGGANRSRSEQYGLYVYLCGRRCHREGDGAVHRNAKTMQFLHEYGEKKWLEEQGKTIGDFIDEFGRNYLL